MLKSEKRKELLKKWKKAKEAYNRNFEKLYKSVGTSQHKKYVAVEKRLHKEELEIISKLKCDEW